MAKCANKVCNAKYDSSAHRSSFNNWCSDACKIVILAEKNIKAKAKKVKATGFQGNSSLKTNKPFKSYSTLKTKKPLRAKTQLNFHSTLQTKQSFKSNGSLKTGSTLKGSAIGSRQYKEEQKLKNLKRKEKFPDYKPLTIDGLTFERAAKKAVEVCHLYIRTRDYGKECICCGLPLEENYQAGHFMESGNNSAIRFDEHNIHGQRYECNMMKGGDSGMYDLNLRAKIGVVIVDSLLAIAKSRVVIRRTIQDYIDIIEYYEAKLNDLLTTHNTHSL